MTTHYQPTLDAPGMPKRYYIRESAYTLADMPARLRPDAEADRLGFEHISDDTLLALILSGSRKHNPVDVARGLLHHFRTLSEIRKTPTAELATVDGMTENQARRLLAALELGKRQTEERQPERPRITTPAVAARIVRPLIQNRETEAFFVLCLDARNRLIAPPRPVTEGILDSSLIHPREAFREAIRLEAAAVVLAHNHPSGDPRPSAEDLRITKQLIEAGKIIDVKVLDHVILGQESPAGPGFVSMRESGLAQF